MINIHVTVCVYSVRNSYLHIKHLTELKRIQQSEMAGNCAFSLCLHRQPLAWGRQRVAGASKLNSEKKQVAPVLESHNSFFCSFCHTSKSLPVRHSDFMYKKYLINMLLFSISLQVVNNHRQTVSN